MSEYLAKLNSPVFQATNRFALAAQGLDIQLLEVYRVFHGPTGASVDVPKATLDAECGRIGAYSIHEKRAVLLRLAGDSLKDEAKRRLSAGTEPPQPVMPQLLPNTDAPPSD